jgi:hypothetical protein
MKDLSMDVFRILIFSTYRCLSLSETDGFTLPNAASKCLCDIKVASSPVDFESIKHHTAAKVP